MLLFDGKDTTVKRGLITQTIILAELVKRGFEVLIPWGDHSRYDLAYTEPDEQFRGARLIRIQCKTAWISKDGAYLIFNTATTHTNRKFQRKGYIGNVEYFVVFSPDTGKIYKVPIEEAPETTMNLRLKNTKNNQAQGIKWAKNYEL
ncbi:MAG: group I intron-associated PD-(D/E)XK endonuclease [Ktedonobacteraceae bacterium]|jgi:hypothetical protein